MPAYDPPVRTADRFIAATKSPPVSGSWVALAADNTSYTVTTTNELILAFQIDEARGPWTTTYKLQWKNVSGGTYTDLSNTGDIRYGTLTDLINGDPSSVQVCTTNGASGSTFTNGKQVEGTSTTSSHTIADEAYAEMLFAINPYYAPTGNTYRFQLYDVGNGAAIGETVATLIIGTRVSQKFNQAVIITNP